jgi:hypothetical protein
MFFSAKELFNAASYMELHWQLEEFDGREDAPVTLSRVKKYVSACKKAILEREPWLGTEEDYGVDLYKWHRPWDVVPKLREFSAPEGEYAVGIEVEMGFNTRADASFIAKKVQHWKYIALDFEGGDEPIEATFPPFLYNKMSSKCQPFRYLKLLSDNADKVEEHSEYDEVGTHVNVSKGGAVANTDRVYAVKSVLEGLSYDSKCKYFGRRPYGYCNTYGGNGKYIEFKLFNSTTDSKVLRKYIHVAVALADIIYGDVDITQEVVIAALETAHSKR